MAQALARITPAERPAPPPPRAAAAPRQLAPREKAAVIVRLLLAEGLAPPIGGLPDHLQAALTEQMGRLRLIDRATLAAVVEEFVAELEAAGMAFPGGIDAALGLLDGHISANAADRLRRLAGAGARADPWDRLVGLPAERLLPALGAESVEVGAVILSKLPVPKAAELLARLPGERARRIAHAMALTGDVDPETVRRIGAALLAQIEALPPRAFPTGPVERMGAILNHAPASTRDAVLEGLEAEDAAFAAEVRRAIFTFVHLPARLAPRDVPRVVRLVEQPVLVTALAGATAPDTAAAAEFLLANMSQRLAAGLREEIAERGRVRPEDAEAAQAAVIAAVRQLEGLGDIALLAPED